MFQGLQTLHQAPISLIALVSCAPEILPPASATPKNGAPTWLTDPTRNIHRALGLGKTNWGTFLRPGVLMGYFRAMFRGFLPQKAAVGEDLLQLGGNFLWNEDGKLIWEYRSQNPTDRPSQAEIRKRVTDPTLWKPG